jgi:hypothetical protein
MKRSLYQTDGARHSSGRMSHSLEIDPAAA